MHAPLFSVNYGKVSPILVDTFDVSPDQLHYSFVLREINFHNGEKLTTYHVKKSLESVIKLRSSGFNRLNNIAGYESFLEAPDNLTGIEIHSAKKFSIKLSKPTPDLIVTLSDLRNVILFDENMPEVGIGPFRIINSSNSEILLENTNKASKNDIDFLRYYKTNKENAIIDFNQKKAHDLFLFPISESDLNGIENGHISTSFPPRTYLFALNSETLELEERAWLIQKLPSFDSLKTCYPDGIKASSISPKGRYGYLEKDEVPSLSLKKRPPKKEITISISNGVGSEKCVQDKIKASISDSIKSKIVIDDGKNVVEKWNQNRYDISFFYLELDNSIDEFQFFTSESSLNLGPKENKIFTEQINQFYDEQDHVKKNILAKKLNQKIIEFQSIKPIYYPKQHLIYSNRYNQINFSKRQDADMTISVLTLKH